MFVAEDGYLKLLHLGSPGTIRAVSLVVKCCQASKNPHQEVVKLLDQTDWRPHLVAAVAVAILGYDEKSLTKLWSSIDARSWVTPQLAVAAYLKDPKFSESAKVRIQAGCPVIALRQISNCSSNRQSDVGPALIPIQSAKLAASLVRLVGLLSVPPRWFKAQESSPELTALLSKDEDLSGEIAESWLVTLKTMLQSLEIDSV